MPAEIFTTGYKALFQVRIQHRYFLDYWTTGFDYDQRERPLDPLVAQGLKTAQRAYDVQQFWRLEPSSATRELLRNQRLLFKRTAEGFCVLTPLRNEAEEPAVPLPQEADFVFLAYLTDGAFPLYTDLEPKWLEALNPTADQPRGSTLLLFNLSVDSLSLTDTLGNIEDWTGDEPGGRPFAQLCIRHRQDSELDLLQGKYPWEQNYSLVLNNRRTTWEYQGKRLRLETEEGTLDQFPLVRYGSVPLRAAKPDLPHPTAANTIYRDKEFVSVIY
jgi:hypothetical protein